MPVLDNRPLVPQFIPLHVLLVEDNPLDVKTVQRAFKKNQLRHRLHFAKDGLEALDILRGKKGSFPTSPDTPKLVLLDLKMPRMDGLEFLGEIRSDQSLKSIVTVVLTTSILKCDIRRAYEHHVAGYIVKALDFDDFVNDIARIDKYWTMCTISPEGI